MFSRCLHAQLYLHNLKKSKIRKQIYELEKVNCINDQSDICADPYVQDLFKGMIVVTVFRNVLISRTEWIPHATSLTQVCVYSKFFHFLVTKFRCTPFLEGSVSRPFFFLNKQIQFLFHFGVPFVKTFSIS